MRVDRRSQEKEDRMVREESSEKYSMTEVGREYVGLEVCRLSVLVPLFYTRGLALPPALLKKFPSGRVFGILAFGGNWFLR
jgi:hypothetical protein